MSSEVLDQILQIVADAFNEPIEKIDASSSPETIENWDSLTHLNFLLAMEQLFECEIDPDESEQAGRSIADAVGVINKKLAE